MRGYWDNVPLARFWGTLNIMEVPVYYFCVASRRDALLSLLSFTALRLTACTVLLKVSPLRGDLQKTPKEYFFESVYLTRWDVFTWDDLLGLEDFSAWSSVPSAHWDYVMVTPHCTSFSAGLLGWRAVARFVGIQNNGGFYLFSCRVTSGRTLLP